MKYLLLFLLLAVRSFAAIAAATVWEVRTTGNANNGGGYSSGGTDYSQQDSAQYSPTDLASAGGVTTLTSVTAGFTSAMVGNVIHITTTGTGAHFVVGYYQITVFTNATTVTIDRDPTTGGAGVAGTGAVGGALVKPSDATAAVSGNIVYCKSGTYTLVATSTYTQAPTNAPIRWIGYSTTRTINNADATHPIITTATNSTVLWTFTGAQALIFKNFEFTTTAGTKVDALANATTTSGQTVPIIFVNCKWSTAFTSVVTCGSGSTTVIGQWYGCEITGIAGSNGAFQYNSGQGQGFQLYSCWIHGNNTGFYCSAGQGCQFTLSGCLVVDNSSRGIYLNNTTSGGIDTLVLKNCTVANNTTAQLESSATTGQVGAINIVNTIFYGTAPIKMAQAGNDAGIVSKNNAFGNGSNTNYTTGDGDITLSASPFTNAGGNDYSLNNTAGGGASCRGAGWPGTISNSSSVNHIDVGAVQHADPAVVAQKSYSF